MTTCRCGYDDAEDRPHPCHGAGYTCRKPATRRFFNVRYAPLAGVQVKLLASETWACDACWTEFTKRATPTRRAEIHTSPYCHGLPDHTTCWDDANGDARWKRIE